MTVTKEKKIRVDETVLRILYFRYKQYIAPAIFFIISLGICIYSIIPQIQNALQTADQTNTNRQTIATLTQNINTLAQIQQVTLSSMITIAASALPQDKNFEAILNGISNAASVANVALADYSFQIGSLQNTLSQQGPLSVTVSLSVTGTIQDAKRFISTLQKQFPLAQVTQVSIRASAIGVLVNFYYAPFPKPVFNPDNPLPSFTKQQQDFLKQLASSANSISSSSAK